MKLLLPLKHIFVTQPFGYNYVSFYKDLGLAGHNGIDFRIKRGCPVYATHDGVCRFAGKDGDGGIGIYLRDNKQSFETIYYHLLKTVIKSGESVKAGDVIGYADNTGKYTTGDHLHFGLKLLDKNGNILNIDNGYRGAIDPSKYFEKNWDKPNAYHRYGRTGNALVDFWFRFTPIGIINRWTQSGRWVQRQLKDKKLPLLNTEQVNAILYGGWDFESVINPAMWINYAYLTKKDYLNGLRSFE